MCTVVAPVSAQDEAPRPQGSIELGLGQTDNLNRNAEELESDIGRIAVRFAGRADRRWFQAALAADVEYRKYGAEELEDEDDEVLGSIDGLLELIAVPDRLQWDFRAGYGQVRIDAFGAISPSNRQQTSTFSTGPKVAIPLGARTFLQIGGLISEQTF